MLMYIMLHVMLAYLMLFAVLSNADFLHSAFFVRDLCFHALSLFVDT